MKRPLSTSSCIVNDHHVHEHHEGCVEDLLVLDCFRSRRFGQPSEAEETRPRPSGATSGSEEMEHRVPWVDAERFHVLSNLVIQSLQRRGSSWSRRLRSRRRFVVLGRAAPEAALVLFGIGRPSACELLQAGSISLLRPVTQMQLRHSPSSFSEPSGGGFVLKWANALGTVALVSLTLIPRGSRTSSMNFAL